MAKGYKVTCLASSFSDPSGFTCGKGWTGEFAETHPLCAKLLSNPAFKFEPCEVREPMVAAPPPEVSLPEIEQGAPAVDSPPPEVDQPPPADSPQPPGTRSVHDSIHEVEGLGAPTVTLLEEAGLLSIDHVLKAGKEGLTQIKGIGDATADRVLALCESYLEGNVPL